MGARSPTGEVPPIPGAAAVACWPAQGPEGGGGTPAGRSRSGDVVWKGSSLAGLPWEDIGAPRPAPFPRYQKVSRSITRPLNSRSFHRINFESLTF